MKKVVLLFVLLLFITGCAKQEDTKKEEVTADSLESGLEEKVAVALWEDSNLKLKYSEQLIGDTLYYLDTKWDEENQELMQASIFRKERNKQEAEEILKITEGKYIVYLVDEAENIYCIYAKEEENNRNYYIKKIKKDGEVIFEQLIQYQGAAWENLEAEQKENIISAEVNTNGEICLVNPYGDLFLFDASGQLLCISNASWEESTYYGARCGLLNMGKEGIFTYFINGKEVSLQKIDMSNGKLEAEFKLQVGQQNGTTLEIYNGYNMGAFISDSKILWRYNSAEKKLEEILNLGNSNVNLQDYMIDTIGVLKEENLYIKAHKTSDNVTFVEINYKDKSEVAQKQIITMAMIERESVTYSSSNTPIPEMPTELEQMISAFNRQSEEYQVELYPYSSYFDMTTDLLQGKGPDLLSLSDMDISVLANKGVLTDLLPYFEKSDIISKEDLLPSILNAWTINNKIVCVFPNFGINGFYVEKGRTKEGGWTPEEFVALGEDYPGAMLEENNITYYYSTIFHDIIQADLENYLDWEKKECYFNSDRFISLLERVKNLSEPKLSRPKVTKETMEEYFAWKQAELERFYNKEQLTVGFGLNSVSNFADNIEDIGSIGELAGYPNQSGKPYYNINPGIDSTFGINSVSECKEGAWTFLEYLLSKEYQFMSTSFPVRQDAFDHHIELKEMYNGYKKIDLSEEEKDYIRNLVAHAYWAGASSVNDVFVIISEETRPVWSGEKTAAEAADIIQKRVSIFMNE